ncbi:hypothetical protein KIN20_022777 [Parelaphostrongylus tenuis]|uniref:Uncharacterized protein n=1 Tax=Parelaphostrongylus tenuis TaxID=148309 RepID=A0AAD5QVL4_PARTN|nr:hypothetical protein KIN20_022777 [Parelaphostrongylus tenuis]
MAKLSATDLITISVLVTTTVLGCGVMPPGQARTRSFTVSGFKLAAPMVAYTGDGNVPFEVPGIARNKTTARRFVRRLVRQAVVDVLRQQGRSAFLPDATISGILSQLSVQINYDPLVCKGATVAKTPNAMSKFSSSNIKSIGLL